MTNLQRPLHEYEVMNYMLQNPFHASNQPTNQPMIHPSIHRSIVGGGFWTRRTGLHSRPSFCRPRKSPSLLAQPTPYRPTWPHPIRAEGSHSMSVSQSLTLSVHMYIHCPCVCVAASTWPFRRRRSRYILHLWPSYIHASTHTRTLKRHLRYINKSSPSHFLALF